jgi:DNA (cytosine-5)-methyltransferase 1
MGRRVKPGEYMQIVGNFTGASLAREIMEVDWMSRDGLREAIPPSYTRYIGDRLLSHIQTQRLTVSGDEP